MHTMYKVILLLFINTFFCALHAQDFTFNTETKRAYDAIMALRIDEGLDILQEERVRNPDNLAVDFIVINPAAFTHTSVALRDAISSVDIPFYEVHLSNVHAREEFRHKSLFSDKAVAVICGLGKHGYTAALEHIVKNN